jgi:hypothetical protein
MKNQKRKRKSCPCGDNEMVEESEDCVTFSVFSNVRNFAGGSEIRKISE